MNRKKSGLLLFPPPGLVEPMPHPVQTLRLLRATSNHVTIEAWRRREARTARLLRVYFTQREMVVLWQGECGKPERLESIHS